MSQDTEEFDVVVVGAGFAGMYLLHLLRDAGFSTVVLERGTDVGGTWYWNRYPGARCDVPSIDYSYSFDHDLEQEWEWSEKYAAQPEILEYAQHVADRFDLRRDIRFETAVTGAHYDEGSQRWTVQTDVGGSIGAQFCIMATGCLSTSKHPELDGIENFDGPIYHTGHWPHEGVDFTGMRVGVIGTGSSGIQSIPIIAEQAEHLTVFQRTPNFSIPAANGPTDPDKVAEIKADYASHRELNRQSLGGVHMVLPTKSALEVDEQERTEAFEDGWENGGIFALSAIYTDLRTNQEANDHVAEFVRGKIASVVDDPQVAAKLQPHDYPLGTKRMCVDSNYFQTYNRDNVRLVDIRDDPIQGLTADGLRTQGENFEFDAIVFATGFDAMTGTLMRIDLRGRGGQTIQEKWADGPRTNLGLMVHGFPNLFTVTGPGSPSVLSNMIVAIEQHAEWITRCISDLRDQGVKSIEAAEPAESEWVAHVDEVGHTTLYPKANSWYMGANVPGKPRVFLPYVGGFAPYAEICEDVRNDGYRGFVLSP